MSAYFNIAHTHGLRLYAGRGAALRQAEPPGHPRPANDNAPVWIVGEEENTLPVGDDLKGFTGHIKDSATGLNYMHPKGTSSLAFGSFRAQARYYDPIIGRFLSIDPKGFEDTGRPSMFNRYAYVSNDPVNGVDPFGMVVREIKRNYVETGSNIRRTASVKVEAGDLTQKQTEKYLKDVPTAVFRELDGQDLSSYDTFTFTDNANDEITPASSELLDKFNIANQIGMAIAPPSKEIPSVSGVSYDYTDDVKGRAITMNNPNYRHIVGFGKASRALSAPEHIATFIHERLHYGGLSGSYADHTIIRQRVFNIMIGSGFTYGRF